MSAESFAAERNLLDLVVGFITSTFESEEDQAAEARARLLVVAGRVGGLRLARSREEFEATYDLLATPRFVMEFARAFADPHVLELARLGAAREIAGRTPKPRDGDAADLAEDLVERAHLLGQLLSETYAHIPPMDARATAKAVRKMGAEGDDIGAMLVSMIGLSIAAYGPDRWTPWMTGTLWTFGRRAVLELARACGVPWEVAVERLATGRDRRFAAAPFNQAASDEAAELLGLQ